MAYIAICTCAIKTTLLHLLVIHALTVANNGYTNSTMAKTSFPHTAPVPYYFVVKLVRNNIKSVNIDLVDSNIVTVVSVTVYSFYSFTCLLDICRANIIVVSGRPW